MIQGKEDLVIIGSNGAFIGDNKGLNQASEVLIIRVDQIFPFEMKATAKKNFLVHSGYIDKYTQYLKICCF